MMASLKGQVFYSLRFNENMAQDDVLWILAKISKDKDQGGTGLSIVCVEPSVNQGLTVLLSITKERRRTVATMLSLKKFNLAGRLQNFDVNRIDEFCVDGDDSSLFTSAETLMMIRHEVDSVRSSHLDFLPVSRTEFYEGQSVVAKLLSTGEIVAFHPLHDSKELIKIADELQTHYFFWLVRPFSVESIRIYWGESYSFYFAFLQALTMALVLPSLFVCIQDWLEPLSFVGHLVFCSGYLILSFLKTELWKRKSAVLAYRWGTTAFLSYEEPRANHRGVLVNDPVTGQLQPYYSPWKTKLKVWCVSFPLVVISLYISYYFLLASIRLETPRADSVWSLSFVFNYAPRLFYSAFIWKFNQCCRYLANQLTEWENHRTETDFKNYHTIKIVLFEVLNNFLSPFYIAFYLQDFDLLSKQLNTSLLLSHAMSLCNLLSLRLRPWKFSGPDEIPDRDRTLAAAVNKLNISMLDTNHSLAKQTIHEAAMQAWIQEDYLDLFIRFGSAMLFIIVNPLGAIGFMTGNFLQWCVISHKLMYLCQRPPVSRASDIGAWEMTFRSMCYLSVLTNIGLVYKLNGHETNAGLMCCVVSQLLLAIRSLMGIIIPSIPASVKLSIAKDERYNSHMKLKKN